ncbi:16S rRNA (uracil(1498)-N(3))-methyltransferase [Flavobacterium silvaticum]|uniref:Ribosomal RNA small subunit methyltransferase E n=1 Tax=Flavobacterium silvaticum TaxID=1852020 RepID=A0A972G229_9FLAO|nr:16S rRNA (uracil(1498)-N(3))-methyltransferase [Flavobacterium silvaticum]NMH29046.1 16S rRNA (uracil(1498)-N(3))-methyltransferase [Flavobacterium silvaticum]
MQLFYNPDIKSGQADFSFDKEESRHIIKVLRKNTGDKLQVTNGMGFLFDVEISIASESKCIVKIVDSQFFEPRPYRLHLAVAPTKMNERYEWFLEKATEIGIDEITPLICDRSERKVVKIDRFEKIAVSAMKQSAQYYLPKLNEAVTFKTLVSAEDDSVKCIAHCIENEKQTLKSVVKPNHKITILIGPEGDFTEKEIELALAKNFIPVSLGHTRLRTETAAVVAAHSVAFLNE